MHGCDVSRRGRRKTHTFSGQALKEKNKELVTALDASRKEVSLLREDNLELKKERQVVMERNACLESKLAVINSAYSDNIKSLIKVVSEMDSNISLAKSLISNMEKQSSVPASSCSLSPILHFKQVVHFKQSSTPVKMIEEQPLMEVVDHKQMIAYPMPSPIPTTTTNTALLSPFQMEISESGLTNLLRPKRSCTLLVESYQEPSCIKKLRQGDPFTDSSINYSLSKPKQKKIRKYKNTPQLRKFSERSGLKDITNSHV